MLWQLVSLATRGLLLRGSEKTGTDEETRVDFRIALGGVASRSAARYVVEGTTVGR
jgi:hypothetical protein